MNNQVSKNIPTVIVALGATGDLMAKKIIPALFHLFEKKHLPDMFKIVGFASTALSSEGFLEHVERILKQHKGLLVDKQEIKSFLKYFSYCQGYFQYKEYYKKLSQDLKEIDDKWGVCSNKLFYLAVPPQYYEIIFNNLAASGLTKPCSPEEGWTRVIVEKPFGKDLKTARKLDNILEKLFKEIQIYRIDHYLAKEMAQNILAFRFSNNLFEQSWNNKLIERIDIRLLETAGVEDRGAFYDGVGALKDVGQNHLLQMLALITMDYPINFTADAIRSNRNKILKTLKILSQKEIKLSTFRAQYQNYQTIKGVASGSNTETYFKVRAFLSSARWKRVPITLESGKRLNKSVKDITITYHHPEPCLFCVPGTKDHYKNKVIFHLGPKEGITIQFWAKKPGLKMEIEERKFEFDFPRTSKKIQYVEEYEKLLLDCIVGDQTLFVGSLEVDSMWRFIDPIVEAWKKNIIPLKSYQPNTGIILKEAESI